MNQHFVYHTRLHLNSVHVSQMKNVKQFLTKNCESSNFNSFLFFPRQMVPTASDFSALNIVGVVFIAINWFMLAPCCIYYTLLYIRKSKISIYRHILKPRRLECILINLGILLYFLLFEQSITSLQIFQVVSQIPTIVPLALSLSTFCLVLYSGIARAWLLQYDRWVQSKLHGQSKYSKYHRHQYKSRHYRHHKSHQHSLHPHSTGYHLAVDSVEDDSTQFDSFPKMEDQTTDNILSFLDPKLTLGSTCCAYLFVLLLYFVSIFFLLIFGGLAIQDGEESVSQRLSQSYAAMAVDVNSNANSNMDSNANSNANSSSSLSAISITTTSTEQSPWFHLAMVQLLVLGVPVLLSGVLMLIVQHCNSRMNRHSSHRRNPSKSKSLQLPSKTQQRLDREIIYILAFTIICCLLRIIISIASNLIVLYVFNEDHNDDENGDYIVYNIWNINENAYVSVLYTAFGQLTVFSLYMLQTWRTLAILNELETRNQSEKVTSTSNSKSSKLSSKTIRSPLSPSSPMSKSRSVGSGDNVRYKNVDDMDSDDSSDDTINALNILNTVNGVNAVNSANPKVAIGGNPNNGHHHHRVLAVGDLQEWTAPSHLSSPQDVLSPLEHVPTTRSDNGSNLDVPVLAIGLNQCSAEIRKCQSVRTEREMTGNQRHRNLWRSLFKNQSTGTEHHGSDRSAPITKAQTYHGIPSVISRSARFKQIFGKSKSAIIDSHDNTGKLGKLSKCESNGTNSSKHKLEDSFPPQIGIHELLSVKEGYDAFMRHLQYEYSAENLSFLTEVAQFKQRFVSELMHDLQWLYHAQIPKSNKKNKSNGSDHETSDQLEWLYRPPTHVSPQIDDDLREYFTAKYPLKTVECHSHRIRFGWFLSFHRGVPLSDILTEDHWRSFLFKAHRIFTKYVENGADSEINISYHCRAALTKYFHSNHSKMERIQRIKTDNDMSTRSVSRHLDGLTLAPQHSMDDLSRYSNRRGSVTVNFVEEDFGGIKKSRSFHNVYEATNDDRYLSSDSDLEDVQMNSPPVPRDRADGHCEMKSTVQCQSVPELTRILSALDEQSFLLQIFDNAATEILGVLRRDSLNRFYETDSYSEFIAKYAPDERKEAIQEEEANGESGKHDINVVFWYFCQCREPTDSSVPCRCDEQFGDRETVEMKQKRMKRRHVRSRTSPLFKRLNSCDESNVVDAEHEDRAEAEMEVIRKFVRHRSRSIGRGRDGNGSRSALNVDDLSASGVRKRSSFSKKCALTDVPSDGRTKLKLKWKNGENESCRRRYQEHMNAALSPTADAGDVPAIVRIVNVDVHRKGSSVGDDECSFVRKSSSFYALVDPPASL